MAKDYLAMYLNFSWGMGRYSFMPIMHFAENSAIIANDIENKSLLSNEIEAGRTVERISNLKKFHIAFLFLSITKENMAILRNPETVKSMQTITDELKKLMTQGGGTMGSVSVGLHLGMRNKKMPPAAAPISSSTNFNTSSHYTIQIDDGRFQWQQAAINNTLHVVLSFQAARQVFIMPMP